MGLSPYFFDVQVDARDEVFSAAPRFGTIGVRDDERRT